jgi:hypothetical protein
MTFSDDTLYIITNYPPNNSFLIPLNISLSEEVLVVPQVSEPDIGTSWDYALAELSRRINLRAGISMKRYPSADAPTITASVSWRRGWDLNPRTGSTPDNALAGRPIRPLWHLSRAVTNFATTVVCTQRPTLSSILRPAVEQQV